MRDTRNSYNTVIGKSHGNISVPLGRQVYTKGQGQPDPTEIYYVYINFIKQAHDTTQLRAVVVDSFLRI